MLAEKFKLSGKTALVTGSSQGIGKGIALALAGCGADVILHCRKNRSEAEQVAEEIRSLGVDSFVIESDLSSADSAAAIYRQIHEKGKRLDILVINASVQIPRLWREVTTQDFDIQVNTNFRSTLQLMQVFTPDMIAGGWGRIITIGSVQQTKPHPAMIIYAATKSAVLNMVRNVAMQLADKGITVNNIAPGVIGTARIEQDLPETDERITKRQETPSGDIGSPEDCAAMAVLLCSEAGRFITGQNINIDGGMSL